MVTDHHISRATPATRRWWRKRGDGPVPCILVVEDDAHYRAAITALLAESAYEVLEAADGVEAVRLLKERLDCPIALVITDILMPKLDGLSLISEIRQLDSTIKIL